MESIKREIEIPEGVKVDIKDGKVVVEGAKGKLERMLFHPKIRIEKEGNKIYLKCNSAKVKEKAIIGSYEAHIRNMIKGVTESFTYKMKIVYSHFPIKVGVKGNEVIIENFLGEKFPRKTKIFGNVKVNVKGDEITVEGINIEEAGQAAAKIESTTRIKDKDIRGFQDGIYITKKG